MGFHNDAIFPTDISYRSRGGPGYRTQITQSADSGAEQRVSRWGGAGRHQYNVAYGIREFSDLALVREFFHVRRGAANGFRYYDWLDCTTAANGLDPELGGAEPAYNDVVIGTGDGSTQTFDLIKRYESAGVVRDRRLYKPIADTVLVGIDGADQASGWSANDDVGTITFTTAPAQDEVITAGCRFHVPVRFAEDIDQLLDATIEDVESGSLAAINLIELINEESVTPDEFFYGGAAPDAPPYNPMDASISISLGLGRVIVVNPSVADLKIFLPPTAMLPEGGPMWYIVNCEGASVDIVDDNGDPIEGDSTLVDGVVTILHADGTFYGAKSAG